MDGLHEEESDDDLIVSEDGAVPKNFSMISHILLTIPELTGNAIHLYLWYSFVCRRYNKCFQSLDTIQKHCRLSRNTILTCREVLRKVGLIDLTIQTSPNGVQRVVVSLKNIWKRSAQWKDPLRVQSTSSKIENDINLNGKSGVQKMNSGGSKNELGGVQKMNPNKTKVNKTNLKRELPTSVNSPPSEDQVGFSFDDDQIPKQPSYCRSLATKLANFLAEKRKGPSTVNLNKWTDQFCRFMEEYDFSKEEIDPVLDWYMENMGGEYVPQAYSADGFCKKFLNIQYQMNLTKQPAKTNGHSPTNGNDAVRAAVLERIRNGQL